jgi:hypothetical protein
MRMSGTAEAEIAKRRRAPIPDEYDFIGRFTKSPISAKSTMSSNRSLTCFRLRPRASAPIMMFRAPERFFMSTAFTPSRAGFPATWTVPEAGGMRPAIARRSVDLPEPFTPMMPDRLTVLGGEGDASYGLDLADRRLLRPAAHKAAEQTPVPNRAVPHLLRAEDAVGDVQVVHEQREPLRGDLRRQGASPELVRVDLEVDLFFDVSHVRSAPLRPRRTGSRSTPNSTAQITPSSHMKGSGG